MPEATDEQMRLLEALEPFRIAASRDGYDNGVQKGILQVYTGLVNWSVRGESLDISDEERTKRIIETKVACEWMERTFPIIRETYPSKKS